MVNLTKEEKRQMCEQLATYLPKIRDLLNLNQEELGHLCGFSRTTVSQIETGVSKMTWSQFTSIMFLCTVNIRTQEYLYANKLFFPRMLQFMQRKDQNIPPDTNIVVRDDLLPTYSEFKTYLQQHI